MELPSSITRFIPFYGPEQGLSVTTAIVPAVIALWAVKYVLEKRRFPLPPGPKPNPVIGNLLHIPVEHPWKTYKDWAKQYGDLIYLEAMGSKMLVLNSLESANALLVKRATNYSNRGPWSPVVDLLRVGWGFAMMNYGLKWREHRRAFHQFLNHTQIYRYHSIIEQETSIFLRHILHDPKEFREELKFLFGSIIMRVSYGVGDFKYNKKLIEQAETLAAGLMKYSAPGRLLVNTFPSLRHVPSWFPGAGWKKIIDDLASINDEITVKPYHDARERSRLGVQGDVGNIAAAMIDALPEKDDVDYPNQEEMAQYIPAQSYIAGADTTMSSANALLLALAMHPEVQRKAQAELDSVVGSDRLPNYGDVKHLIYIQAIIKEVTRWHTVAPLGVPHVSDEEDVYNGYRIPAKTIILANTWAIMHDPELFDDPMTFRPERYIKNGQIDTSVLDPEAAAFGYGRRICPGRHLSTETLILVCASLLSCFDLKPSVDENGKPVPLEYELPHTLIVAPLPYDITIVPRSAQHAALVNA